MISAMRWNPKDNIPNYLQGAVVAEEALQINRSKAARRNLTEK